MKPSLIGARNKLDRAKTHFDEVNAAIEATLGAEAKASKLPPHEYQPDRQQLIIRCPKPRPIDPSLSLAIGDCVHNLRSALDHLAFQLAVLNGKAKEAETMISFPVFLCDKKYQGFIGKKVEPFIDRGALALIQELQPYYAGNLGKDDILWVLSQLDVIDKHRMIVAVSRHLRPEGFSVRVPGGEFFENDLPTSEWKPMEDGTEIIRFDLTGAIPAEGKVEVKLKVASIVSLEDTGLPICEKREIRGILSTGRKAITQILDDFGAMYFGESLFSQSFV
jgi:hypothetical protein